MENISGKPPIRYKTQWYYGYGATNPNDNRGNSIVGMKMMKMMMKMMMKIIMKVIILHIDIEDGDGGEEGKDGDEEE